jgi:O-antigen/teichoic acid export membrane protein
MELKRKALSGVIWSATQIWGQYIFSFILFAILARLLSPGDFGLITIASIVLELVQILVIDGIAVFIIQRSRIEPHHLDTAFWMNLFLGIMLFAVIFSTSEVMGTLFNEEYLPKILRWLSIVVPIYSLGSIHEALLKRDLNFRILTFRTLFASLFSGIIAVLLAFLDFGVWSLVSYQLINCVLLTLFLWFRSAWKPGLKLSSNAFNEIFRFSSNVLGLRSVEFISRRLNDVLIGIFLGTTALGYYNIAYRLLSSMTILTVSVIGQTALPIFAKNQDDPIHLRQSFKKIASYIAFLCLPLFVSLSILSPKLILFVFGYKWSESIPIMQILAFSGIAYSISFILNSFFIAIGKPGSEFLIFTASNIFHAILFILFKDLGLLAATTIFTISRFIPIVIRLLFFRELLPLNTREHISIYFEPLLSTSILALSLIGMQIFFDMKPIPSSLEIIIVSLTGFIIYILSVKVIAPEIFIEVNKLLKLSLKKWFN